MMEASQNPLSRIRRNHALEHATIHVLNQRYPRVSLVGRSDMRGFFLYADLPVEAVASAVEIALDRLRAGEKDLAVHPNCGTNMLTSGVLSGAAAYFSLLGVRSRSWRDRLDRLPLAIMAAIVGGMIAKPLGQRVQEKWTTDPNPGNLAIASLQVTQRSGGKLFRVKTSD